MALLLVLVSPYQVTNLRYVNVSARGIFFVCGWAVRQHHHYICCIVYMHFFFEQGNTRRCSCIPDNSRIFGFPPLLPSGKLAESIWSWICNCQLSYSLHNCSFLLPSGISLFLGVDRSMRKLCIRSETQIMSTKVLLFSKVIIITSTVRICHTI